MKEKQQKNTMERKSLDEAIMAAIHKILGRGNNAEVKQTTDGSIKVYEVEKHRANF